MRLRNAGISLFAVLWILLFHYESLRHHVLNRLAGRELPKVKFLFPPASWIMFFRVEDNAGGVEVYGLKDQTAFLIDPHRIFETRWVGYDNIHRNVLSTVADPQRGPDFCRYLQRKFPGYDGFIVAFVSWPSLTNQPDVKNTRFVYRSDKEGRVYSMR